MYPIKPTIDAAITEKSRWNLWARMPKIGAPIKAKTFPTPVREEERDMASLHISDPAPAVHKLFSR